MFLNKYLNEFNYNLIINNYEEEFLNSLNEEKFLSNYYIFKKYNFYFINDIILKYLELFTKDYEELINEIENLKNKLGDNFVYKIGNNLNYLNELC